MCLGRGEDHAPTDIHLTLCEVISSRLRVPCVTNLVVELILDDDLDGDLDALFAEPYEEI